MIHHPQPSSLAERLQEQAEEALGSFNRYVAGLHLGHEPSDEEALLWYIEHGGAEAYARRHDRREQ